MASSTAADLDFLRDLVTRAGTLAVAGARDLRREFKADQSLVTNVDRGIERFLREELAQRFPGDAFYGEESGGERHAPRLWVVDPIDGTTNMVWGLPMWGVSVGLLVEGVPELGAVSLPKVGELFSFRRGGGAYRNGRRLRIVDTGELHREDTVAVSSEAVLLADFSRFHCRVRNFGSAVAHYCYTASGAFRATVSLRERLHDLGAVYGLVKEAGGAIEWLAGGEAPLSFWLENPQHEEMVCLGPKRSLDRVREIISPRQG